MRVNMKKEEKIKRKEYNVFFYKLSVKPNLFNQENEIYNSMLKFLKINLRDRQLCDINGCKAYVNFIKEKNGIYLFYFEKYRQEELPQIENIINGNIRNIYLEENEAITEKTCFALCFNETKGAFYIAYVKLQHSYEPSSLLKYISQTIGIKEDELNLSIILHKDTLEKLYKYEKIKGYSYTIATPNETLLKEFGLSKESRFILAKEQVSKIKFEISLEETQKFTKSKKEKINKLISNNTDCIKKLIMEVCSKNEKPEKIDLFKDIFKDKIKVNINKNNAINLESIGEKLIET
ncbi:hypothetical protein EIY07_08510, partial [Campylobacter jejuni]|nr:hypothetical protein [Campylobacter jejuni]